MFHRVNNTITEVNPSGLVDTKVFGISVGEDRVEISQWYEADDINSMVVIVHYWSREKARGYHKIL